VVVALCGGAVGAKLRRLPAGPA